MLDSKKIREKVSALDTKRIKCYTVRKGSA